MFLKDIEIFRGVRERNDKGETLEEFLDNYDPKKYDMPSHTVDMIVFRCSEKLRSLDQNLQILLIQRKNHPCIGMWGTPGGFVDLREDLIDAAKRELEEETGYKANKVTKLGIIYPSCGYTNEKINLFLGENLEKSMQNLEEDEFVDIIKMPLNLVKEQIKNGEIKDAKTIVAIYHYLNINK